MNDFERLSSYVGGGSKGNVKYDIHRVNNSADCYYILYINGEEVYNSLQYGEIYEQAKIDEIARQKGEEYLRR